MCCDWSRGVKPLIRRVVIQVAWLLLTNALWWCLWLPGFGLLHSHAVSAWQSTANGRDHRKQAQHLQREGMWPAGFGKNIRIGFMQSTPYSVDWLKNKQVVFVIYIIYRNMSESNSWLLFVCRRSTSARCTSRASCWASWRQRWAEWLWVGSRLKRCSWVCKWDILPDTPFDLFTPNMHQLIAVPTSTYW